jgi:GH43 family beta-xylosidase
MKNFSLLFISLFLLGLMLGIHSASVTAQNPFIRNQFTADPSARVFNGKVYVFPSHDIKAPEGKNLRKDWFCMEDYHVFSSENLADWTDHGMILSQYDAPWVDSTSFSMWAPDCIERNGKYYFYFPANTNVVDANGRKGFGIGVAVADKPEGPYVPQEKNIEGIRGIDPNVLIDKDGQAYIYWSLGHIFVAKLKENMLELDSEPMIIPNLPEKGLKEGPWVFERNGIYYLTFPHVENKIERIEYAMGENPMGPFKMTGVIMDESPTGCWTNHHSVIEYNKQWYLFYHHNDLSPRFDKNRSVRVDSLFFNSDGTIQKVQPTLRGVGLTPANSTIDIDRYSALGSSGVRIEFNDTTNTFSAWKSVFEGEGAWIQYNAVDFGANKLKKIQMKARSEKGGTMQIRLNKPDGPLLGEVKIPAGTEFAIVTAKAGTLPQGVQNIVVLSTNANIKEIDWVKFE